MIAELAGDGEISSPSRDQDVIETSDVAWNQNIHYGSASARQIMAAKYEAAPDQTRGRFMLPIAHNGGSPRGNAQWFC